MKKFKLLSLFSIFIFIVSCETLDLDGTEDPSAVTEGNLDREFYLNGIQTSFSSFFFDISNDSRGCVRMVNQFGTYSAAADPQNTQSQWTTAYTDILQEINNMKKISNETDHPYHIGIANVIEAYTMVTLVDFYGDVPYTEALKGAANLTPKVDSGASIYDAMLTKLDQAIVLFSKTAPLNLPDRDFYYNSDYTKWIKLANSLKLKMYNNLRLTRDVSASVNQIIASGNFMSSNADDFNFKYNTTTSPTDSRHPDYVNNYLGAPVFYLSNTFYKLMFQDKTVVDPRSRYFFYRQTSAAPTGQILPCTGNPSIPICHIGSGAWGTGYWGRDHADNSGLPNDAARRTVVGLYPAGGRFDNNNFANASTSTAANNANGAGILNILDFSFVQFMLAELALKEPGVNGTPLTFLTNGVNANITKVMSFRTDLSTTTNTPSVASVNNYKNQVTAKFNAATTVDDKLNVVIKEFYIASFGNGLEAYNMYRRTGMPMKNTALIGMQSPVFASGDFIRSFFYPSNAVNNNTNITQKTLVTRVFWDNNPANFID